VSFYLRLLIIYGPVGSYSLYQQHLILGGKLLFLPEITQYLSHYQFQQIDTAQLTQKNPMLTTVMDG